MPRYIWEDDDRQTYRGDLQPKIMEFRGLLSDAGLYYAPETSPVSIFHYLGLEGDEADQWATIQGYKDMMSHRDESNMEMVIETLNSIDPTSEDFVRLDNGEYAVRVLEPSGELTDVGQKLEELAGALMDYPVLSDEDVSRREYEETLENIRMEAPMVSDTAPDDWEEKVFGWLWENNQDALDYRTDTGGSYPSEEQIGEALKALGWLEEEEDENLEFDRQGRYKKGLGDGQLERIARRLKK